MEIVEIKIHDPTGYLSTFYNRMSGKHGDGGPFQDPQLAIKSLMRIFVVTLDEYWDMIERWLFDPLIVDSYRAIMEDSFDPSSSLEELGIVNGSTTLEDIVEDMCAAACEEFEHECPDIREVEAPFRMCARIFLNGVLNPAILDSIRHCGRISFVSTDVEIDADNYHEVMLVLGFRE